MVSEIHLKCKNGSLYCDGRHATIISLTLRDLQEDIKDPIDTIDVPFTKEYVKLYIKLTSEVLPRLSIYERYKFSRIDINNFFLLVNWFDPPDSIRDMLIKNFHCIYTKGYKWRFLKSLSIAIITLALCIAGAILFNCGGVLNRNCFNGANYMLYTHKTNVSQSCVYYGDCDPNSQYYDCDTVCTYQFTLYFKSERKNCSATVTKTEDENDNDNDNDYDYDDYNDALEWNIGKHYVIYFNKKNSNECSISAYDGEDDAVNYILMCVWIFACVIFGFIFIVSFRR